MIKLEEMNFITCDFRNTFLQSLDQKFNTDVFNKGVKASLLMHEVYWSNLIDINMKQHIYYLVRVKHHKEFKSKREMNLYGLGWNWFNTGYHIYSCTHIVQSDYVTKSNHIKFSKYINRAANCNHCLFCNNISNKSFMAFNQPVEPKRFYELQKLSLTELKKQPEFNASLYKMLRRIHKVLLKGESHNECHNDK